MDRHSQVARLGVDIGGTFTDVVLETAGHRYSDKVLTTYDAPEKGVIEAIDAILARASVRAEDVGLFIHGTTLATNALIERKGAKTALITTDGFRDVLEIRVEHRFEQYDLFLDLPEALVPRDRNAQIHLFDQLNPGIVKSPDDVGRVVSRTVIDDDQFPLFQRLPKNALDRFANKRGDIERGHDDGKYWLVVHCCIPTATVFQKVSEVYRLFVSGRRSRMTQGSPRSESQTPRANDPNLN